MSTPYVGLKQVFGAAQVPKSETPWDPMNTPMTAASEDYRKEVKRRLIHALTTQFGIETIQVGPLVMKLTEAVPDRHLLKAVHYLLEQYKAEPDTSVDTALLTSCLKHLLAMQSQH